MPRQDFQQGQIGRPRPVLATPDLTPHDRTRAPVPGTARTERDFVALGIIVAAIILFVGTGSSVLPRLVRHLR
jgi:hypothetical protein